MTLAHNTYFDGAVQSLAFERAGERASVGVMLPGSFHFGTEAPERMTVISGVLRVKLPQGDWTDFGAGAVFDVPGNAGFDLEVAQPTAYLCEYLAP